MEKLMETLKADYREIDKLLCDLDKPKLTKTEKEQKIYLESRLYYISDTLEKFGVCMYEEEDYE